VLADHGVSGVSTHLCERPEGRRLFDILREGDALVVRWVDGLGRGSAKRRKGGSGSGLLLMDCLRPEMAASNSGRMVTFRHRVDRLQLAFRPSRAEAYQCSNMDLPLSRPPHCGTFGTPTRCFPRAIRKTLVQRFRWSARSMHGSRKTADLLTTVFTRRESGENVRTEQIGCLPERGKRSGATVWAANRPSRKYTEVQVKH
jgi:hypothetical protein